MFDDGKNLVGVRLAGKRLLVTGAGGFIATSLVGLLRQVECHIVRFSRGSLAEPVDGPASVTDVAGDVRDVGVWRKLVEDADVVFHLAAQTSATVANQDPVADAQINLSPALALLEASRQSGRCPTVLFAGTETQAGLPGRVPADEALDDVPVTVYDLHKKMAEEYLLYYARARSVRGACLRLTTVYGPGPPASDRQRGVLNRMIRDALEGKALTIYGSGDFLRDYVHVHDVARAFIEAACHIEKLNAGYYLVGSGEHRTVGDAIRLVATTAEQETGKPVRVVHIPEPPDLAAIDKRDFIADARRFRSLTGWAPVYSLADGIRQTVRPLLSRKPTGRTSPLGVRTE